MSGRDRGIPSKLAPLGALGGIDKPMPETPLGSYYTPEGLRRSARINLDAIPEQSVETGDPTEEAALEGILGSMSIGGKRKRKQRGGAVSWQAVKDFAKRAASATGQYLQTRVGDIVIEEVKGATRVTISAADQVLITFMSLVTLLGGVFQFTIGTTKYILKNTATAATSAAATMKAPETQQLVADKTTALANLPFSIAVAVAALTQAGIISLTTVVAIVLRGIGAATSGAGRAAATLAFYGWYLKKTPEEQKTIREQGAAVANATGDAAKTAIATLTTTVSSGITVAKDAVTAVVPMSTPPPVVDTTKPLTDAEKGEAAVLLAGATIAATDKPELKTAAEPIATTVKEVITKSGEGEVPIPKPPAVTGVKTKVVSSLLPTRSSTRRGGKKRQPKRRITRRKPFAY